jgi:hypothetical protein
MLCRTWVEKQEKKKIKALGCRGTPKLQVAPPLLTETNKAKRSRRKMNGNVE